MGLLSLDQDSGAARWEHWFQTPIYLASKDALHLYVNTVAGYAVAIHR